MYKKLLAEDGFGKRDLVLAQNAFYAGARGVLKMLGYLAERGDMDELERVVHRHTQTIRTIQGLALRKRRH
jgi:hypothetical protein